MLVIRIKVTHDLNRLENDIQVKYYINDIYSQNGFENSYPTT